MIKEICKICGKEDYLYNHHIISRGRLDKIPKHKLQLISILESDNDRNKIRICKDCHEETTSWLIKNRKCSFEEFLKSEERNFYPLIDSEILDKSKNVSEMILQFSTRLENFLDRLYECYYLYGKLPKTPLNVSPYLLKLISIYIEKVLDEGYVKA